MTINPVMYVCRRAIAKIGGSNFTALNLSNCDNVANISTLINECKTIKTLNLQSAYLINDTDCIAIASGTFIIEES